MVNRAIILANGLFPKRMEALQAILQAPLLVCCDGAYDKLVASGLFSHASTFPEVYVVGDGDSLKTRRADGIQGAVSAHVHFVEGYTDQDTNDLSKAVRFALTKEVTHLLILGATGLREDHTLGNISLLAQFAAMRTTNDKPLQVRMYTDYGFFTPLSAGGLVKIPSFPRQQVSLFSLGDFEISVEGLKYPIQHRRLVQWWEATLNESIGDSFSVDTQGTGTLLVYQTHQPKE